MKRTIEWHEECLSNAEISLTYEAACLATYQRRYDQARERFEFRRTQIAEARRRGLDGFDADRFLKSSSKGAKS